MKETVKLIVTDVLRKGIVRVRNKRTNQVYLEYSIVEIGHYSEKNPGDLI